MLRALEIRDMLIIDRLDIEFQPGLNVLTGETGAGKSILLDALGFVLGWRGRADLVREGADQGEVVAVFDLPSDPPVTDVLNEAGLPVSDELVLRRVNARDGRKSAWVNDRRASGEVLRALSERLVELHGQHDDRGLLNPRGHRQLLDAYAGHRGAVTQCRKAWRDLSGAEKALADHEAEIAELKKEEDFLRHAAGELSALDPKPGEEETLDTRRRLMQAGARVSEDVGKAAQALGLDGAEGLIADATRWLEAAGEAVADQVGTSLEALARTRTELGEAQAGVEALIDALRFDPHELEQTEERLFSVRGLARKHGVQPDDLADLATSLADQLGQLEAGVEGVGELRANVDAAQAAYQKAADALSTSRAKAARKLDKSITRELKPLKMEHAVFTTEIGDTEPGPEGRDQVQFTVSTNPGAPPGPLNRIASGGELSRFMLALKVCLTGEDSGLTLIFDEIDRGVGGATADAVGRRLSALATSTQVLVVTHSPQVAALGDHHWRVEKRVAGNATLSRVTALGADDRVDETARMLAGDKVTDEARAAARALLAR
jgi:DNA repair protein RecN (Recombination protein N)